ncbi:MAG: protocadherin, partial [bacterium]|nr:protocadherin [bacterium]
NQWGYTSVNAKAGYGVGGTRQVASKTAVRGPYGNVVSGGRGASFVNGQFVGGRAYTAVNRNFTHWGYFGPGYYQHYPGAWFPGKWAIVGTAWSAATWATAGSYCGCEGEGTYYDYEDNVTFDDGNVLYEGEAVATQEQYYNEAENIADSGADTSDETWLPLGVFAVVAEPGQTKTDKIVQLALSREGAIRGNYQDMLTDKVTPVTGAVDKKTQRVALRLQGNDSLVVEVGLYNLTNDEVPALVHKSSDQQTPITLIRLKNPEDESQQ